MYIRLLFSMYIDINSLIKKKKNIWYATHFRALFTHTSLLAFPKKEKKNTYTCIISVSRKLFYSLPSAPIYMMDKRLIIYFIHTTNRKIN